MTDTPDALPDEDHDHHHHEGGPLAELVTLRDWLRYAVTRFNRAGLAFGHGLDNAFDEAAYLLLHTLSLPLDRLEPFLDACITSEEREEILAVIERRVDERVPAAYLTGEAWLGDFRFRVDPRVIVPRSFIAELFDEAFAPWVSDPENVGAVLDLCTGSGCLAILAAHAFPHAHVVAADLSEDALAVAEENIAEYALEDRVETCRSDVFSGLAGRRFDLIVCNPPYVTAQAVAALPPEYLHEPEMALGSGEDGLDFVRPLLAQAAEHLNPGGVLVVEIGNNRAIVEEAFPELPFTWVTSRNGTDGVFVLTREDLPG